MVTLENISVLRGYNGIDAAVESSFTATDIVVDDVSNAGILVSPSAETTVDIADVEVSGVGGSDNNENGILITGGSEITFADALVKNTNNEGVKITSGSIRDQSVSASTIELVSTLGFYILQNEFRSDSITLKNISVLRGYNGIGVDVASSLRATKIAVNNVRNTGMFVDASTETSLDISATSINGVSGSDNEEDGIYVEGSKKTLFTDIIVDNAGSGIVIYKNTDEDILGKSVTIDNATVTNSASHGISVEGNIGADDIGITDSDITRTSQGVFVTGGDGSDSVEIIATVITNAERGFQLATVETVTFERAQAKSIEERELQLGDLSPSEATIINSFEEDDSTGEDTAQTETEPPAETETETPTETATPTETDTGEGGGVGFLTQLIVVLAIGIVIILARLEGD